MLNKKILNILLLLLEANTRYGIIDWKLIKAMREAIKIKKRILKYKDQIEFDL